MSDTGLPVRASVFSAVAPIAGGFLGGCPVPNATASLPTWVFPRPGRLSLGAGICLASRALGAPLPW